MTAIGNGGLGVYGLHVRLRDSSVTGSGTVDVVSRDRAPTLSNTQCGTSSDNEIGGTPWGVCGLDP